MKNSSFKIKRGISAEYSLISPHLVFGISILTLGLYTIHWLYEKNKELIQFDKEAPEPLRGAILMMVFPFIWFFTMTFIKITLSLNNLFTQIIEIVGYGIIFLLILKYLIDFCISFTRVTNGSLLLWLFLFFLGIGSLFSIFFAIYLLIIPLLIFPLTISSMQAELNSFYGRYSIKREKVGYYH